MSIIKVTQLAPFQPLTQQLRDALWNYETILQTNAKLSPEGKEIYKMRLKDQHVLLESTAEETNVPAFCLKLDFSVKFQKITTSKDAASKNIPNPQQQLKGFRLIHENGESIALYIQFAELASIWVKFLRKYINQLGFHKEFRPVKKLGKGSSAAVYEIIRLQNGERMAAKVFSKEILKNNPQKFYSFKNEVDILRTLDHTNLLKLQGVFQTDHSYYVILQVLKGGNLLEYLMHRKTYLKVEEIRAIMRNVVKGLAELEKYEIAHRDIKLENIMMREKEGLELVIVDFGLAINTWEDEVVFKTCGTPGYLSPEIIKQENQGKITAKSDIFSAGVVFHVLLMGRYLFSGSDPKTVFESNRKMDFSLNTPEYSNVDKSALDLLRKMLTQDPNDRIGAAECLEHEFLAQEKGSEEKVQISPASTSEDYHF